MVRLGAVEKADERAGINDRDGHRGRNRQGVW
jgi:hypothetical protein